MDGAWNASRRVPGHSRHREINQTVGHHSASLDGRPSARDVARLRQPGIAPAARRSSGCCESLNSRHQPTNDWTDRAYTLLTAKARFLLRGVGLLLALSLGVVSAEQPSGSRYASHGSEMQDPQGFCPPE